MSNAVVNNMETAAPKQFVILGHGTEDIEIPFEERDIIPEGYILVTLAQCGAVTVMETVAKFLEAFKYIDPELSSPAAAAESIGLPVHVYRPGYLYPNLTIKALVDWVEDDDNHMAIKLMKSGLYSYPLDPTLFTKPYDTRYPILKNQQAAFRMFGKLPQSLAAPIKALYNDSIFPNSEQAADSLERAKMNHAAFAKEMTFPLEDFFKAGGPGIYFYIICRSPKELNIDDFVESYVLNNDLRMPFKTATNIIPLIPSVIPVAENLAEKEATRLALPGSREHWNTNTRLHTANKLKSIYNRALRTRRHSIEQGGRGGRRGSRRGSRRHIKTRRAKKRRQKNY